VLKCDSGLSVNKTFFKIDLGEEENDVRLGYPCLEIISGREKKKKKGLRASKDRTG
jgi:hypothetical protein